MLMLERSVRIREVKGSNPSRSTKEEKSEPFSNKKNPNLFQIGEGIGFFVFFGELNHGAVPCPRPY